MTINKEKLKDILEDFENDRVSEGVFVSPNAYSIAIDRIVALIQPKTTSTDIEGLREEIERIVPRYLKGGTQINQYFAKGWNECREEIMKLVIAPHLSNESELREKDDIDIIEDYIDEANREFDKSELKKEAVREFGEYYLVNRKKVLNNTPPENIWAKNIVMEMQTFERILKQYLSSNEKEVK